MKQYLFNDSKELAEQLAKDFSAAVSEKAASGGSLTVALSGGHTPKTFFEVLADQYRDSIAWNNVVFFWGDERCVPPDNDESNFKMTNGALLSNIVIPSDNIHRVLGEDPPHNEALRYEQEIKEFIPLSANGFPRFDWIFLGMGSDGHTASLFPGAPTLEERDRVCVVAVRPETGQKRISVTFPVLNNAKRVSFLVAGDSKAPVLKEIMDSGGKPLPYPASMVNPSDGVLEWYLDKAAAPWL